MNGYIKLHRKLVNWEWYTDQNTFKLFIHCLLMANHKPNKWRGIVIDAGEFITSFDKLKIETGLSIQQVRTSLKRLILTKEIEHKSTSQYSVIKVLKYSDYQSLDDETNKQNNKQLTNKQQTNNKRITTNKNDKNDKNDKNKEYKELFLTFCNGNEELNTMLNEYYEMRKDIKKPMTERAIKMFLTQLSQLSSDENEQIEMLRQSVINSWQSVYPLKNKETKQKSYEVETPDYMQKKGGLKGYVKVD